jgi:hypothetical protein
MYFEKHLALCLLCTASLQFSIYLSLHRTSDFISHYISHFTTHFISHFILHFISLLPLPGNIKTVVFRAASRAALRVNPADRVIRMEDLTRACEEEGDKTASAISDAMKSMYS